MKAVIELNVLDVKSRVVKHEEHKIELFVELLMPEEVVRLVFSVALLDVEDAGSEGLRVGGETLESGPLVHGLAHPPGQVVDLRPHTRRASLLGLNEGLVPQKDNQLREVCPVTQSL